MIRYRKVAIATLVWGQRGFTLIEAMVVIAIIGITAAIIVPSIISYRQKASLRATAAGMLGIVRNAQVEAVKRNFNTVIRFDAANRTVSMFVDDGSGGGTPNNGTMDGGEVVSKTLLIPNTCSMPDAKITFAGKQSGFTARGLPQSIGTVEIHPAAAGLNVAYQVSLSLAGHVKLRSSTNGGVSWK